MNWLEITIDVVMFIVLLCFLLLLLYDRFKKAP